MGDLGMRDFGLADAKPISAMEQLLQGWIEDLGDFVVQRFCRTELPHEVTLRAGGGAHTDVQHFTDGAAGDASFEVSGNGGAFQREEGIPRDKSGAGGGAPRCDVDYDGCGIKIPDSS